jgi:hypothetical protein
MIEDHAEKPLVTVIIPSFNGAAYIGQALRSALDSPGVPLEIIVVDDGSTDDTFKVLEGFDTRVRLVRQERGGPYRARNHAARLARGDWLAFLDADDDWLPGKLAAQVRLAASGPDLVYTDRLNFGDLSRVKERQSDSVTLHEGDIFEPLLLGNFITLSSVLMRKSAFEKLGGFAIERRGVQDWDMWLRYSSDGGRVGLCREPLTRGADDQRRRAARCGSRSGAQARAAVAPRQAGLTARRAPGIRESLGPCRITDGGHLPRSDHHFPPSLRLVLAVEPACLQGNREEPHRARLTTIRAPMTGGPPRNGRERSRACRGFQGNGPRHPSN